jgi:hypothetical protein
VIYAVRAEPLPPLASLLVILGPLVAILYWLRQDARSRQISLVHDWGLFAYLAWPILIPWYVYRTRGPRGWPLTLWLFLGILAPLLLAAVVLTLETLSRGGAP